MTITNNHHSLYVEVRALRVALDEAFAWGHLVAHEHVEDFVGLDSLRDAHL